MFKKTTHTKLIVLASLMPILSFGTVGVISYYSINGFVEDEKWVQHTHQVIEQSDAIEKTMLDIETGSRGYAITGDPIFLEPFYSGISNIKNQLDSIHALTIDNPTQQENIKKLTLLIEQKTVFMNKTYDLRKNVGVDAALNNVRTLEGKNIMDEIRHVINDMKNEENSLLAKRTELSHTSAQNTDNVIIIGSVIAIAITGISTFTIYRKMQQRDEVEKANVELHFETEKLRERDNAKAELSAMVSHELKTPLVTISGYAEMLKENGVLGTLNKEQTHAVDTIISQTVKLERLISDIMDAQKMDLKKMKFNKREFEVGAFMDEQIQNHSKLMDAKKIHFVNSTSDEKINITSDPDRLSQVFANLIKNAVDFAPTSNGRIEINAQSKNGQIVFYVKDNGSGIPKEKQENLFKKFYQIDTSLKRSHGGTGLGLVICKGIVDALGGTIWLDSEVGQGATFWFSIPNNGSVNHNKTEV